jgi:hypothetical protein
MSARPQRIRGGGEEKDLYIICTHIIFALTIKRLIIHQFKFYVDQITLNRNEGSNKGAAMYDDHQFEETPEGIRITSTMTVVGVLGFLWRKIVVQDIVDKLPAEMLNQVKAASAL